jgi:cytosine/uracil/thiamine/allantoin permease
MYSVQGIFQPYFQCKKVHTILDKIWQFYEANERKSRYVFIVERQKIIFLMFFLILAICHILDQKMLMQYNDLSSSLMLRQNKLERSTFSAE